MNDTNERVGKASKDALRYVYYVIIGIAITEALRLTFISNDNFLGRQIFEEKHLIRVILLWAFLFTICRFVHGASIHYEISNVRYKSVLDFGGFCLQAIFFYLMAVSLNEPSSFSYLFIGMLIIDVIWLVILRCIKLIEFGKIHFQWLFSDIILIVMFFQAL